MPYMKGKVKPYKNTTKSRMPAKPNPKKPVNKKKPMGR